jgi:hypothetical protein
MTSRIAQFAFLALLAACVLLPDVAEACPTCKDNLTRDGQLTGMARGYAYSILFMLSMPPLIFGSLSAYFYWEVRKARRAQAAVQHDPATGQPFGSIADGAA